MLIFVVLFAIRETSKTFIGVVFWNIKIELVVHLKKVKV